MLLVTFAVAPLPLGCSRETQPHHALGLGGAIGPGHCAAPGACPYLFIYFQGLQSQEEQYSPHGKKMEQEIVQKGMVK